jgi:hypothetical protein
MADALDPQLQARLENLEKQLFQIASKNHRTMYRQTEEASPLAKLEATIRLLDSDFQQFRGTDPKRLVDALVTQYHTNFRQEIEERLATRASEEELLQFQKDIFRIESFTRETQVNVFSLKSKLEHLGTDLESRFTEQRWSAMESNLAKAAAKQQEDLTKELRGQQRIQEEQVETKLKGVQSLLTLLEKEVKTQYGPEMLQDHMRALEQGLSTTVRTSLADATHQLTSKVSSYEGQTQALRQLVLEAVADIKQELQGAALQARFQSYETRLAEQEERYKILGQQYSTLEAHLKRQTAAAQDRQSDLYQELEQTQAHIKELDAKAVQAQQQVAANCAKWLKDREQSFDIRYGQTEATLSNLQGKALLLEEELGLALQQRKVYEEAWKDQYRTLQKTLEEKFTAWTDDKTVYLTSRVVDLTQQLQGTIQLTKLHQRRVDELLAEENIRGFVTAIETKVRITQDEWAQRRNAEFSLKFDTYTNKVTAVYRQLETDRQQAITEKEESLSALKLTIKEQLLAGKMDLSANIRQTTDALVTTVRTELLSLNKLKSSLESIQDTYEKNTNEAILFEKYTEFQDSLKTEIRKTITENQIITTQKQKLHEAKIADTLKTIQSLRQEMTETWNAESIHRYSKKIEEHVLKTSEDWQLHTRIKLQEEFKESQITFQEEFKKQYELLDNLCKRAIQKEDIDTIERLLQEKIHKLVSIQNARIEDIRTKVTYQINNSLYEVSKSVVQSKSVRTQDTTSKPILKISPTTNTLDKTTIYTSLSKCFYTAVFGTPGQRLDTLGIMKPPPGWDAFCFTNQPDLQANGWTIIEYPMDQATPVLQSKFVKWNSHTLLEDYDVAVWIDAYLSPNLSSTNLLQQWIPQAYTAKASIIHRKHDARNCVWDECKAVVESKRDTPEHVEALKQRLLTVNMPKQFGLFDTNMMIRFHKLKACQDISDAVWSSLQIDTHRDQLVVTPVYFTKGFKTYATVSLQQAFDRSGTHIRNLAV